MKAFSKKMKKTFHKLGNSIHSSDHHSHERERGSIASSSTNITTPANDTIQISPVVKKNEISITSTKKEQHQKQNESNVSIHRAHSKKINSLQSLQEQEEQRQEEQSHELIESETAPALSSAEEVLPNHSLEHTTDTNIQEKSNTSVNEDVGVHQQIVTANTTEENNNKLVNYENTEKANSNKDITKNSSNFVDNSNTNINNNNYNSRSGDHSELLERVNTDLETRNTDSFVALHNVEPSNVNKNINNTCATEIDTYTNTNKGVSAEISDDSKISRTSLTQNNVVNTSHVLDSVIDVNVPDNVDNSGNQSSSINFKFVDSNPAIKDDKAERNVSSDIDECKNDNHENLNNSDNNRSNNSETSSLNFELSSEHARESSEQPHEEIDEQELENEKANVIKNNIHNNTTIKEVHEGKRKHNSEKSSSKLVSSTACKASENNSTLRTPNEILEESKSKQLPESTHKTNVNKEVISHRASAINEERGKQTTSNTSRSLVSSISSRQLKKEEFDKQLRHAKQVYKQRTHSVNNNNNSNNNNNNYENSKNKLRESNNLSVHDSYNREVDNDREKQRHHSSHHRLHHSSHHNPPSSSQINSNREQHSHRRKNTESVPTEVLTSPSSPSSPLLPLSSEDNSDIDVFDYHSLINQCHRNAERIAKREQKLVHSSSNNVRPSYNRTRNHSKALRVWDDKQSSTASQRSLPMSNRKSFSDSNNNYNTNNNNSSSNNRHNRLNNSCNNEVANINSSHSSRSRLPPRNHHNTNLYNSHDNEADTSMNSSRHRSSRRESHQSRQSNQLPNSREYVTHRNTSKSHTSTLGHKSFVLESPDSRLPRSTLALSNNTNTSTASFSSNNYNIGNNGNREVNDNDNDNDDKLRRRHRRSQRRSASKETTQQDDNRDNVNTSSLLSTSNKSLKNNLESEDTSEFVEMRRAKASTIPHSLSLSSTSSTYTSQNELHDVESEKFIDDSLEGIDNRDTVKHHREHEKRHYNRNAINTSSPNTINNNSRNGSNIHRSNRNYQSRGSKDNKKWEEQHNVVNSSDKTPHRTSDFLSSCKSSKPHTDSERSYNSHKNSNYCNKRRSTHSSGAHHLSELTNSHHTPERLSSTSLCRLGNSEDKEQTRISKVELNMLKEVEERLDTLREEIAEHDAALEQNMLSNSFERLYHLNNKRDRAERECRVQEFAKLTELKAKLINGEVVKNIHARQERRKLLEERLRSPDNVFERLYLNSPTSSHLQRRERSRTHSQNSTKTTSSSAAAHSWFSQKDTRNDKSRVNAHNSRSATRSNRTTSSNSSNRTRRSEEEVCKLLYTDGLELTRRRAKQEKLNELSRQADELEELLVAKLAVQLRRASQSNTEFLNSEMWITKAREELHRRMEKDPDHYVEDILKDRKLSKREQQMSARRLLIHGKATKERLEAEKRKEEMRECTFRPKINEYYSYTTVQDKSTLTPTRSEARNISRRPYGNRNNNNSSDIIVNSGNDQNVNTNQNNDARNGLGDSSTENANEHRRKKSDRCVYLYKNAQTTRNKRAELESRQATERRKSILKNRLENDHHFRRRVQLDPTVAERFMKSLIV